MIMQAKKSHNLHAGEPGKLEHGSSSNPKAWEPGANGINLSLSQKAREPGAQMSEQEKMDAFAQAKSKFFLPASFCSIQALNGLEGAHLRW